MSYTREERNRITLAAIKAIASDRLEKEVAHFLDIDDEEGRPRDVYGALIQAHDFAEENKAGAVLKDARRALIWLRVYHETTPAQLARIETFKGGRFRPKRPAFRLVAKTYIFANHLPCDCAGAPDKDRT